MTLARWARPLWLATMCLLVGAGALAADGGLVPAVREQDARVVRQLLATGADPNAPEADGTTALHLAALADDQAIVRLLLDAGAKADAANRYGMTPLALAAVNGSAAVVGMLLEAGADPNAATPEGETVLMTAARTGASDAIDRLIAAGADVNARERWRGETALMWAAAENNAAAVRLLIERGAGLDVRSTELDYPDIRLNLAFMATTELPRGGFSALMLAARQGAEAAARVLLEAGADPDLQDPEGTTATMLAIINAHYDVAALLVDRGADPNVSDRAGMGALYAAVDMHTMRPLTNLPPRRPSGDLGPLDVARRLLARGADPDAALITPTLRRHHSQGDGALGPGATALMRAARFTDVAALRLLLEHGASARLQQRNGSTALTIAAGAGARSGDGGFARTDPFSEPEALEAIALLIAHGADVDAAGSAGETALHAAAARGRDAVVRLLVEHGADLHLEDGSGRTPLDVALGRPAAGGRGPAPAPGPVHESTAALLRELTVSRPPPGREP